MRGCAEACLIGAAGILAVAPAVSGIRPPSERWSAERARDWGAAQGWRLGANYLPSPCANVLDLFEKGKFNTTLLAVERELRIAEAIGLSTMRVFLHEHLYHQRGEEFLEDLARLLDLFQRRGMFVMLVLFDACWMPDLEIAQYIPGVHNSAWVQCPTHDILRAFAAGDATAIARLRRYVVQVVGRFAADPRVAIWDIYNEASMRSSEHWILPRIAARHGWQKHPSHWLLDGEKLQATFKLLHEAFAWARSAGPTQPLTTAVWDFPGVEDEDDVAKFKMGFNQALLDLSDVVSMHCYCEPDELQSLLTELSGLQRGPVLLTEFMARPRNSTVANSLPILRHHGAWGYTWGFFRGRSQTHRSWDTWMRDDIAEDALWFHDLFHENGTAYDPDEIKDIWWHTRGRDLSV